MTRIKICGLTRFEDALAAVEHGADALGFVFAERSRRRADPETVARFTTKLPPLVTLVGVFQDQPLSYVREVMAACRLNVAQLHGNENARYMQQLELPCYKAVSVATESDLEKVRELEGQGGFLLDSGSGGTGKTFDWSLAIRAKEYGRVILAGGLGPENVGFAVSNVHPWGVDTASGVEKSPGVKDIAKIREFINKVKNADREAATTGSKEVH